MDRAPSGAMKFLGPRRELKEYALNHDNNNLLSSLAHFLPIEKLKKMNGGVALMGVGVILILLAVLKAKGKI